MKKGWIIYGCGEMGQRICDSLQDGQSEIQCFFDKGKHGKYKEIPICLPREKKLMGFSFEPVIIISLSDGTKHKEIVEELYSIGYIYFVFIPLGYMLDAEKKIQLTEQYNKVLEGNNIINEIEKYDIICSNKNIIRGIIKKSGECVWVWMSHEILYSENIYSWTGDMTKIRCVNNGIDVNLNQYYWYHELFDYLEGKRTECNSYLSIFNYNAESATEKIKNREKLYNDLKMNLQHGMEFFKLAAPGGVWNENAYFNIIGGNHRTVFLQHQGFLYYPIKISKSDFTHWMNEPCLNKILEYMEREDIKETYVPIPHPYFFEFPSKRENRKETVLKSILKYFGPIRLKGKRVVDASQYQGYFARVSSRMQAEYVSCFSEDAIFCMLIMGLLHIKNVELVYSMEELRNRCHKADYVFAMANIKKVLDTDLLTNYEGELFIESEQIDDSLIKQIYVKTSLDYFEILHRGILDGRQYEIAVFKKGNKKKNV